MDKLVDPTLRPLVLTFRRRKGREIADLWETGRLDALARSGQRVMDLFRAWDEDRSGTIDKAEFYKKCEFVSNGAKGIFFALDEVTTATRLSICSTLAPA